MTKRITKPEELLGNLMTKLQPGAAASEQECVEMLLNGIPSRGTLNATRATFEKIVRAAFRGGWATSADPCIRPDRGRDMRQEQVHSWCAAAFGRDHITVPIRALRLLEEAIEVYQSATLGLVADECRAKAHALVDYVFSRVDGHLPQEIGGVGVTLLALCQAAGISADEEEVREIARVTSKPLEHFRARNEAKKDAGFSFEELPGARS